MVHVEIVGCARSITPIYMDETFIYINIHQPITMKSYENTFEWEG